MYMHTGIIGILAAHCRNGVVSGVLLARSSTCNRYIYTYL